MMIEDGLEAQLSEAQAMFEDESRQKLSLQSRFKALGKEKESIIKQLEEGHAHNKGHTRDEGHAHSDLEEQPKDWHHPEFDFYDYASEENSENVGQATSTEDPQENMVKKFVKI